MNNKYTKPYSKLIKALLLLVCISLICSPMICQADDWETLIHCKYCGKEHDIFADCSSQDLITCKFCGEQHDKNKLGGFERAVWDMNDLVYAAQLISDDNSDGSLSLLDALIFNVESDDFADLWNKARDYYRAVASFGVGLAMIYSLVETLAHLKKDTLIPEYFVKEIMRLTLAIIIVINGFDIITGLLNLATGTTMIFYQELTDGQGDPSNCLWGMFEEPDGFLAWITGPLQTFFHFLSLLIPWLIMTIAKIVVAVVCWGRIIELITRVILAPIGISDLFVYGANSNGVKYLKKMLVCAIQGAVVLAMLLSYRIIVTASATGKGQWIVAILMAIVLLTSVTGTKEIASDVCGV